MKQPEYFHRARELLRWKGIIAFLATGLVLLITIWAFSAEMVSIQPTYFVLLTLVCSASAMAIYKDKFWGLFSPVVWTSLGFIYFLIVGPLINPQNLLSISRPEDLPYYLAVLSVGIASYYIGALIAYRYRIRLEVPWFGVDMHVNGVFIKAIVTFGVFLVMNIIVSKAGGFKFIDYMTLNTYLLGDRDHMFSMFGGGMAYYLLQLSRFFNLGIALSSVYLLRQDINKWKKLLLLPGLLFVFITTFSSGARMRLATWLGAVCAYLLLSWGRRADFTNLSVSIKKIIPLVLLGVLGVFLLTAVQIGFRVERANLGEQSINLREAIFNNLLDDRTDQNVTLYLAAIADRDDALDHLRGESYALAFVKFIPRALWPDKPGGDSMYQKLEVINPWKTNQNITHSVIGEVIYNFGILAIVPGMIFFGYAQGQLFHLFLRYKKTTKMNLLYAALLVPTAFFVRGEFHTIFAAVIYGLFILILIII